jgi:DNA-binding transcriptional MerR regulator
MPVQYPIRAVSKMTGISVDTLRAWERRYNAVTPERGERGRVYNDAHVQRLLLLQAALGRGFSIGVVASLPDEELQAMLRAPQSSEPTRSTDGKSNLDLPELRPLLKAIESFDFGKTNEELSRLALLLSPAGLVYKVVLPVLQIAGDNWENGIFPIAQEHMFSACVRNLLGGLVRFQKPPNTAVRLLLTTPANELHEFGILSAALLAISRDFHVAYLGPSLPAQGILMAANKCQAQIVVLGIMKSNLTLEVRDDLRMIASELPPSSELWLGGSGAAEAVAGIHRKSTLCLDDLPDFERHLSRIQEKQALQVER